MKRAESYKRGVRWIAFNDEPLQMDAAIVAEQISAMLLADIFDLEPIQVGRSVVNLRKRDGLAPSRRDGGVQFEPTTANYGQDAADGAACRAMATALRAAGRRA